MQPQVQAITLCYDASMEPRSSVSVDKRIFILSGWAWLAYLGMQAAIDFAIYFGKQAGSVITYYIANLVPAFLFLILAKSRWARKQDLAPKIALIAIISLTPLLLVPLLNLNLPQAPLSNIEGMVLRQVPIQLIGLLLVAWHFSGMVTAGFIIATTALEIMAVTLLKHPSGARLQAYLFTVIIRSVSFFVAGFLINQLLSLLKKQQTRLEVANKNLSHYASVAEGLAISRERNRMSRELHDTAIHALSGLTVQLETAKAYTDKDLGVVTKVLDQALDTVRTGLTETRRALKALRATPLDDLGLIKAIINLAESAAARAQLELVLDLPDGTFFVPPDIEQGIYRILQEAIENTVHHANARTLKISLQNTGDEIIIEAADDGVGFSVKGHRGDHHFGIKNMQERAQLAGGSLTITSQAGKGTVIRCVFKEMQA